MGFSTVIYPVRTAVKALPHGDRLDGWGMVVERQKIGTVNGPLALPLVTVAEI